MIFRKSLKKSDPILTVFIIESFPFPLYYLIFKIEIVQFRTKLINLWNPIYSLPSICEETSYRAHQTCYLQIGSCSSNVLQFFAQHCISTQLKISAEKNHFNIANLSPSPKPSFSWGLRWLYSQIFPPPTSPATHLEKYERAIKTRCFQNKSC